MTAGGEERSDGQHIGALVRSVRESKGISLRGLAAELGVSPATVSQLETGKSQVSAVRLVRIAEVLGVPLQDLVAPAGKAAPPGMQATARVPAVQESPGAARAGNGRQRGDLVARAVDSGRGPWREFPELDLDPVLRAALHAFHTTGYHGSSMRDIAAGAGMSVPGLYHHFSSKQAMLGALLRIAGEEALWRARAARDEGGDPVERLGLLVESVALYNTHRQAFASVGFAELRNLEGENRAAVTAARTGTQKLIDAEIAAGIRAGLFAPRHPKEAGRAVVMLCTALANWFRPEGSMNADEVARLYSGFALDMLRPEQTYA